MSTPSKAKVIKRLIERHRLSPEEAEWAWENGDRSILAEGRFEQAVAQFVASQGGELSISLQARQAQSKANKAQSEDDEPAAKQSTRKKPSADEVMEATVQRILDKRAKRKADKSQSQADEAVAEAVKTGAPRAVAEEAAERATTEDGEFDPVAFAEIFSSLGGAHADRKQTLEQLRADLGLPRLPTDEDLRAAMREFNQAFPDLRVDTVEELLAMYASANGPLVREAFLEALDGTSPQIITYHYRDMDGRLQRFDVEAEYVQAARQIAPGFQPGKAIALQARTGTPWQPIALVLNTLDIGKAAPTPTQLSPFRTEAGAPTNRGPGVRFREEESRSMEAFRSRARAEEASKLQALQSKYGDWSLAYLAIHDPELADAIYNQGGPTREQAARAQELFFKGKWDPQTLASMGFYIDPTKYAAILDAEQYEGRRRAAAAPDVKLPNRDRLEEGVRSLWRSWFQRDPNQGELDSFVNSIHGMVRSAAVAGSAGNPFKGQEFQPGRVTEQEIDPQATLLAQARQTEDYRRLFSQMREGLSEEEYVAQFRAASGALLGAEEAGGDAIRAGMESGSLQTTIGHIAGTREYLEQNSTLRQRIARAAQLINART